MNLATHHVMNNAARDQSFLPTRVSSIVPAHMVPLASQSRIWESLVISRASIAMASKRMNVSLQDARKGLAHAADRLRARQANCERAYEILEASGAVKQEISRRAWDEVALGIRHSS